jgi:hypothetical protein
MVLQSAVFAMVAEAGCCSACRVALIFALGFHRREPGFVTEVPGFVTNYISCGLGRRVSPNGRRTDRSAPAFQGHGERAPAMTLVITWAEGRGGAPAPGRTLKRPRRQVSLSVGWYQGIASSPRFSQ